MNPVETYIFEQSENKQQILTFFHDLFVNQYGLTANIKWKIPTYYGKTWVTYLNPDKKKDGIHVCFVRGNELSEKHSILKAEGRKMVKSMYVDSLDKIPYEQFIDCIKEAITLDKTVKYKAPNSKK
ncbi:DUF1801 domain-containing protein [Aquimarina agarilytica]|uniref:DUF1801 domain-containing protein n=1 Tax=Aquimarina agarilytica TaxID=1087449 RepID=UPI000289BB33|nr:DUF1801 domain-containing protein [Aquimarina agarilytica]